MLKKRNAIKLLKLVVLLALSIAIYQQIFLRAEATEIWAAFLAQLSYQTWGLIAIVIALMLANWSIEAKKWQQLIAKVEKLSFWAAFQAILCGITLALFTPNRVGEYGGRVLILQKADKIEAIAITLIGSLSQIIVNIAMGMLGIIAFTSIYQQLNNVLLYGIVGITIVIILFFLVLYYHLHWIKIGQKKIPYLKKWVHYVEPITQYSNKELTKVLCLSFLRHSIFSLQYLLLLWTFGIDCNIFKGLVIVNSIFFVQTLIPSIALVELGVRGNVALFFIGYISLQNISILAATFSLWFINLLLPALLGMFLLLRR